MKIGGREKRGDRSQICAVIFLLVMSLSFISASDVAYIYDKEFRIDQNVIDRINYLGLDVDLIESDDVLSTDFSSYRFLYVGDERFSNAHQIPVNNFPSVVTNYRHGGDWGLTDSDGISSLAGNSPLEVLVNNRAVQVYTDAFFHGGSSIAIPYYYLNNENIAPSLENVAKAYNGDGGLGDVISYAYEGDSLAGGKDADGRICFYGIAESDYWTSQARNMFDECLNFVGSACDEDSDCGEDSVGENYCDDSDDVVRDLTDISCEAPGSLDSVCSAEAIPELVEECDDACVDGECEDFECESDSDCDDSDEYTRDICLEPGTLESECEHEPLECVNDSDCDDENSLTLDSCVENVCENILVDCTENSQCGNVEVSLSCDGDDVVESVVSPVCSELNECGSETSSGVIATCEFGCLNGECLVPECEEDLDCPYGEICLENECVPVECVEDSDCDDSVRLTLDSCVENECVNELIVCLDDGDCGDDVYGGLECVEESVVQDVTSYSCENAGSLESYCDGLTDTNVVEICSDICFQGECVDVICESDADCDDNTPRTIDQCANAGTQASFCRNTEVNCIEDLDCGITGFIGDTFCLSDNIYQMFKTSECENAGSLNSFCVIEVRDTLTNSCDDGDEYTVDMCVQNGQAFCEHDTVECLADGDCGSDFSDFTCIGDDRYEVVTDNFCGEENICGSELEQNFVESCAFGCVDGDCLDPECEEDLDCPYGEICLENECVEVDCVEDSDCGVVSSEFICLDDDLFEVVTSPLCTEDNLCSSDVDSVLVQECEFGCAGGECLPDERLHDIALSNLKIRDIAGNLIEDGRLIQGERYRIYIDVENGGDFSEDVSFNGNILDGVVSMLNFSHVAVENLAPGEMKNNKYRTVDFEIDEGIYELVVEGIIDEDDDLSDNVVLMEIVVEFGGECRDDDECDDGDELTLDMCVENICEHDVIACLGEGDCPGDIFSADFCNNGDVVRTVTDFSCDAPGTAESFCSSFDFNEIVEQCDFGCENGECLIPECVEDSDCGVQSSEFTCVGDDLFEVTTTQDCGIDNTCSSIVNEVLIQHCDYGCANRECIDPVIECYNDGDCDDSERLTLDSCVAPGTPESFCVNDPIDCTLDSDCAENEICSNNHCVPVDCTLDSQCGVVDVVLSCDGDDVVETTTTPVCEVDNTCSEDVDDRLIETCEFGCSQGTCLPPECVEDSDCPERNICDNNECVPVDCTLDSQCGGVETTLSCDGSDVVEIVVTPICNENNVCQDITNENVIEQCDFGCENNQCVDPVIACESDNECGEDGFIGEFYCSELSNEISEGFIPKVAYWHPFGGYGGRIILTGEDNKIFAYGNDRWNNIGENENNPAVGFYYPFEYFEDIELGSEEGFVGGTVQIERTGEIHVWKSSTGNFHEGSVESPFPESFTPKIAYWHPFGGYGGRIILIGEDGTTFVYGDGQWDNFGNDNEWNNWNTKVGFYYPFEYFGDRYLGSEGSLAGGVVQIDHGGTFHIWKSGDGEFTQVAGNNLVNMGLPSNEEISEGYYDPFNNRVVLWYGDEMYESDDGIIFTRFNSNGVVQDYQDFSCLNPGEESSSCDSSLTPIVIEMCVAGCVGGGCEVFDCLVDSDCADGNRLTEDSCNAVNECENIPIECTRNSDCGSVANSYFCDGDDLIHREMTPTCTESNICISDVIDNPTRCDFGCNGAQCLNPECVEDIDCADGNRLTEDSCNAVNECENIPIECTLNSDCNDGNEYTLDSCRTDNTCENTPIACLRDSDCPADIFSNPFCSNDDVVRRVTDFSCSNAGSTSSSCNSNTFDEIIEECSIGCSNGMCEEEPEEIEITLPEGSSNYTAVCPLPTISNPSPLRYVYPEPISTPSLEAGELYTFYCSYGNEDVFSSATIRLDSNYKEIKIGEEKHRFSKWDSYPYLTYTVPDSMLRDGNRYILNAGDYYVWETALINGELNFKVKRNMFGEEKHMDVMTPGYPTVYGEFSRERTCPVYRITMFSTPHTVEDIFGLIYGEGLINNYEWQGIDCRIVRV